MTSDHQLNWVRVIIAEGLLVLLLFAVVLLAFGVPTKPLVSAILRIFFVASIGAAAFGLLERYAWAWPVSRWCFGTPPDLRGRWKGVYKSSFDQQPRDTALEIRQTMLSIRCDGWGPGRKSESYSCRILSDRDGQVFKLAYLYRAKPLDPTTAKPGDEHEGFTILEFNENATPKALTGMYFNTREPDPMKAYVELAWESRTLLGRL